MWVEGTSRVVIVVSHASTQNISYLTPSCYESTIYWQTHFLLYLWEAQMEKYGWVVKLFQECREVRERDENFEDTCRGLYKKRLFFLDDGLTEVADWWATLLEQGQISMETTFDNSQISSYYGMMTASVHVSVCAHMRVIAWIRTVQSKTYVEPEVIAPNFASIPSALVP